MNRRHVLLTLALGCLCVGLVINASTGVHAQNDPRAMPLSGSVLDAQLAPVAGAQVALVRHSSSLQQKGEGQQIVARATTDATGHFSFGSVALDTSVAFPLETGVSFDYLVATQGHTQRIQNIAFTAPRSNYAITSVNAEIHLF